MLWLHNFMTTTTHSGGRCLGRDFEDPIVLMFSATWIRFMDIGLDLCYNQRKRGGRSCMKEKIYTIPVNDAFDSGDECPFCYLEREVEQRTIRYVLGPGASYMEPDVRAATDAAGFCRGHYQKMFDYGNTLGSALMMQTYYARIMEELNEQLDDFEMPDKRPLLPIRKHHCDNERGHDHLRNGDTLADANRRNDLLHNGYRWESASRNCAK